MSPKPGKPSPQSENARAHQASALSDDSQSPKTWFVYILRCADGPLYTGITNELAKRLARHNAASRA